MGPQQAHREEVAARGRLYFQFLCRWTLRSVRHGDVLFYCYVARNCDIRTIPTWRSFERLLLRHVFWPKMLPPCNSYRPSSYRAIQQLYSGTFSNSHEKRETRCEKKKFPTKTSRLSEFPNIIPALNSDIDDSYLVVYKTSFGGSGQAPPPFFAESFFFFFFSDSVGARKSCTTLQRNYECQPKFERLKISTKWYVTAQ